MIGIRYSEPEYVSQVIMRMNVKSYEVKDDAKLDEVKDDIKFDKVMDDIMTK